MPSSIAKRRQCGASTTSKTSLQSKVKSRTTRTIHVNAKNVTLHTKHVYALINSLKKHQLFKTKNCTAMTSTILIRLRSDFYAKCKPINRFIVFDRSIASCRCSFARFMCSIAMELSKSSNSGSLSAMEDFLVVLS